MSEWFPGVGMGAASRCWLSLLLFYSWTTITASVDYWYGTGRGDTEDPLLHDGVIARSRHRFFAETFSSSALMVGKEGSYMKRMLERMCDNFVNKRREQTSQANTESHIS